MSFNYIELHEEVKKYIIDFNNQKTKEYICIEYPEEKLKILEEIVKPIIKRVLYEDKLNNELKKNISTELQINKDDKKQ